MVSERCIFLLVALLLTTLVSERVAAQTDAGRSLGFIIQPPVDTSAPLGFNATFRCEAVGNVFWSLGPGRGSQIQTRAQVDTFRMLEIFFPLSKPSQSEVVVTATRANNETVVRCLVEESFGSIAILNTSAEAQLLVYDEPSPPANLNLQIPTQGLGVMLSWQQGFAHRGEDVTFVITSREVATGSETEANTSLSSITLNPTSQSRTCQQYNFTVFSQNLFSLSLTGISEMALIPTIPLPINTVDIQLNLDPSLTLLISVPDLSPCEEYGVENLVVTFSEISNDIGMELAPSFNVSSSVTAGGTSLTVTSGDGLLSGRQYNITIIASNTAGSSFHATQTATTGLQAAIVAFNSSSALISCLFADAASSQGCQVSFGSANTTILNRVDGLDIINASIPVPPQLTGTVVVTVTEILSDGNASLITRQTTITIPPTTSPATEIPPTMQGTNSESDLTSAELSTDSSTSTVDTSESFLSGTTLYIIIAVIVGIIFFLLSLIIIIMICVIRNQKKNTLHSLQLSSSEELKPNNVYGDQDTLPHLTTVTDLGGLQENCRQVRSNTYDDPQHVTGASNGATAAVPTYETVHSAKKAMLNASGPPVLNPVYGPTCTPSSPISPCPIPVPPKGSCSSVLNPVYSETGSTQLPMVSPLSPVYAAVGKHAIAMEPVGTNKPPSVGDNPSVPLYEELQRVLPSQQPEDSFTKNESYGLLNTIEGSKH